METTALPTRPNRQSDPTDMHAHPDATRVANLRTRLLRDAFLFEDPRGYQAGVEDAIAGFEALLPAD